MTDEPQADQHEADTRTPDQVLIDVLSGVELRRVDLVSEGQRLDIIEGVNLIVGPNNSGKSTLITEIYQALLPEPGQIDAQQRQVVSKVGLDFRYGVDNLLDAVAKCLASGHSALVHEASGEPQIRTPARFPVSLAQLKSVWTSRTSGGSSVDFFATHLEADQRPTRVGPVQAPNLGQGGGMMEPLQRVWGDRNADIQLKNAFKETFGEDLFVNRLGATVSLHIGSAIVPPDAIADQEYVRDLEALKPVANQGHGMRAFLGIMLSVVTGTYSLILIDEPELFLHPPQARRLAEILFKKRHPGARIVISTHSSDIVQGFVSACEGKDLAITRLTRKGNTSHLASIAPTDIEPMYTDALLRRSMILDGLFYHGVVVCEAEGDSTYYSAVDEFAGESDEVLARPDLHFTYAQGNARMARVVKILRAARVPVASIVDIDTLAQKEVLKLLVEAHGGVFEPLAKYVSSLHEYVSTRHGAEQVDRADALKALREILSSGGDKPRYLSKEELEAARDALKGKGVYEAFKLSGKAILYGVSATAFETLASELAKIGIFAVEGGELESFYRHVTGEKRERLNTVLTQGLFRLPGPQHEFVLRVRTYLTVEQ